MAGYIESEGYVGPPPLTPEDVEDELISLAVNLAKERLRDGSASNQLIAEIIKMGTAKERLQKEKLMRETEMLTAKTESLKAQKHADELYEDAIKAMRLYAGFGNYEATDDEDGDGFF